MSAVEAWTPYPVRDDEQRDELPEQVRRIVAAAELLAEVDGIYQVMLQHPAPEVIAWAARNAYDRHHVPNSDGEHYIDAIYVRVSDVRIGVVVKPGEGE